MKNKILPLVFLLCLIFAGCSQPEKVEKKEYFSHHDRILFEISECARSRRDKIAYACLERYRSHVFNGKLLYITYNYMGANAQVDIGQTEITCKIHATNQNFHMMKSLLVGDIVAVNGRPEQVHNERRYNNLVLTDCTMLPTEN